MTANGSSYTLESEDDDVDDDAAFECMRSSHGISMLASVFFLFFSPFFFVGQRRKVDSGKGHSLKLRSLNARRAGSQSPASYTRKTHTRAHTLLVYT